MATRSLVVISLLTVFHTGIIATECPVGEVAEIQPTEEQIMLCRWYEWNKQAIDCGGGEWPYLDEMLNFCQMYQLRKRLFSSLGRNWVEKSKQCIVDEMKRLKV